MSVTLVIVGMALVNLIVRCPLFLMARRVRLPDLLERALAFTPIAVLTAFIVPAALHLDQFPDGSKVFNPDLAAALVAVALSWFTRNLTLTIVLSLGVAITLRQVWPA